MSRKIAWRADYRGHGINVKFYGTLEDGGTDEQRERAWQRASADWWNMANLAAQEHGYHGVGCDGRSGGWLVPMRDERNAAETEDEPSAVFHAFEDVIERMMGDVPRLFRESLAAVIAEDNAAQEDANREARRADMVPGLVSALRALASYTGGSDEKPGHPCREAWDALARWDAAQ